MGVAVASYMGEFRSKMRLLWIGEDERQGVCFGGINIEFCFGEVFRKDDVKTSEGPACGLFDC